MIYDTVIFISMDRKGTDIITLNVKIFMFVECLI